MLTGILVRFEPGKLVMAATDSYRLSVKETPIESESLELEAIVPARALGELARIAQAGDTIQLGVRENQVIFGADDTWLTTRRIDGQFPNYRQLLPESFEHEVTLPRAELLESRHAARPCWPSATRRCVCASATASWRSARRPRTSARPARRCRRRSPATRSRSASTPSSSRTGSSRSPRTSCQLKLISPLRPAVIQADGDDFVYLIMPIRLAG